MEGYYDSDCGACDLRGARVSNENLATPNDSRPSILMRLTALEMRLTALEVRTAAVKAHLF